MDKTPFIVRLARFLGFFAGICFGLTTTFFVKGDTRLTIVFWVQGIVATCAALVCMVIIGKEQK